MTNKINGIDVSECEYFEKQHIEDMYESDDCNVCIDNFCALYWKECEKHNGCYFKQLKRLQEENKGLKEKVNSYNCNANCYKYKEANKYKQALENMRTYINQECKNKQCPQTCANCFIGNVLIKVNEVLK